MAVLTPRVAVRNGSVSLGRKSTSTGFSAADGSSAWSNLLGQTKIVSMTTAASVDPSTESSGFCDVPIPRDEKIGFLISWWASSTANTEAVVCVSQGSEGRAWQRDLGKFSVALSCTYAGGGGYQHFLGPFESARFAYESTNGDDAIKIWLVSSSTSLEDSEIAVEAFVMPSVSYST